MHFRERNTDIIVRRSTYWILVYEQLNIQVYLNVNGLDTSIDTFYEHSIMSLLHFHLHPIPPQPKLTTPLEKKNQLNTVLFNAYIHVHIKESVITMTIHVSLREQYQYLQYFLNVLEDCVKSSF